MNRAADSSTSSLVRVSLRDQAEVSAILRQVSRSGESGADGPDAAVRSVCCSSMKVSVRPNTNPHAA